MTQLRDAASALSDLDLTLAGLSMHRTEQAAQAAAQALAQALLTQKDRRQAARPRRRSPVPWDWDCQAYVWCHALTWWAATSPSQPRRLGLAYLQIDAAGVVRPHLFAAAPDSIASEHALGLLHTLD